MTSHLRYMSLANYDHATPPPYVEPKERASSWGKWLYPASVAKKKRQCKSDALMQQDFSSKFKKTSGPDSSLLGFECVRPACGRSILGRVIDRVSAAFSSPSSSSCSSSPTVTSPASRKPSLIKADSLDCQWRHENLQTHQRQLARRSRSLERNHRYLVTIDPSCRYSREVGSHLVEVISAKGDHLAHRYQPDPTCLRTAHGLRLSSTNMSTVSTSSTSIVGKSNRGWLHPDHLFAKDGINYNVRYIGCLEVTTSMKLLDFETRSLIAKECINRVCEAAGIKSSEKKRSKADKKVSKMLRDCANLEQAGVNAQLSITSDWLKLSDVKSGQTLFLHDMPNISFASGGDSDTLNFVAYVAKTPNQVRNCYVIECCGGSAQDVITTIGQAFELRFKEFLKRTPLTKPHSLKMFPSATAAASTPSGRSSDDVEYYNDLPGKCPPDVMMSTATSMSHRRPAAARDSLNSNLIDFNTEILPASREPEYVNGDVVNAKDPFDLSPLTTQPPNGGLTAHLAGLDTQRAQLSREEWFHGPISRKEAEQLLVQDGDFLVRESQGSSGQYVLTGMQNHCKKHLLLVDPEGNVRTKDRSFDSVSHLINFHRNSGLPIISAESALRLKNAVHKPW